jgi:hypothetical protein
MDTGVSPNMIGVGVVLSVLLFFTDVAEAEAEAGSRVKSVRLPMTQDQVLTSSTRLESARAVPGLEGWPAASITIRYRAGERPLEAR